VELVSASVPLHLPRGSMEDVFHVDDDVLLNTRGGFDDDAEATLGEFIGLQKLLLMRNRFTDELPPEIGNLLQLLKDDPSGNLISGEVPTSSAFGSLSLSSKLLLVLGLVALSRNGPPRVELQASGGVILCGPTRVRQRGGRAQSCGVDREADSSRCCTARELGADERERTNERTSHLQ
jgi:hypothetical protein